jgi:hypothetical protein
MAVTKLAVRKAVENHLKRHGQEQLCRMFCLVSRSDTQIMCEALKELQREGLVRPGYNPRHGGVVVSWEGN